MGKGRKNKQLRLFRVAHLTRRSPEEQQWEITTEEEPSMSLGFSLPWEEEPPPSDERAEREELLIGENSPPISSSDQLLALLSQLGDFLPPEEEKKEEEPTSLFSSFPPFDSVEEVFSVPEDMPHKELKKIVKEMEEFLAKKYGLKVRYQIIPGLIPPYRPPLKARLKFLQAMYNLASFLEDQKLGFLLTKKFPFPLPNGGSVNKNPFRQIYLLDQSNKTLDGYCDHRGNIVFFAKNFESKAERDREDRGKLNHNIPSYSSTPFMEGTILHEIGHFLFSGLSPEKKMSWYATYMEFVEFFKQSSDDGLPYPSGYFYSDPEEGFAEIFAGGLLGNPYVLGRISEEELAAKKAEIQQKKAAKSAKKKKGKKRKKEEVTREDIFVGNLALRSQIPFLFEKALYLVFGEE